MISDICFSSSVPPSLLPSLSLSPSLFLSVCFQCQFCCVSMSHGSFWPTHGQTHSKPVRLISILPATFFLFHFFFSPLTKLCRQVREGAGWLLCCCDFTSAARRVHYRLLKLFTKRTGAAILFITVVLLCDLLTFDST